MGSPVTIDRAGFHIFLQRNGIECFILVSWCVAFVEGWGQWQNRPCLSSRGEMHTILYYMVRSKNNLAFDHFSCMGFMLISKDKFSTLRISFWKTEGKLMTGKYILLSHNQINIVIFGSFRTKCNFPVNFKV